MARPVIALITDFGTRDHYVGAMKGVGLGICPDLTFVDITHEIDPQDTLGCALELAAAYPYFPPGTIFLVVVDPGVGSTRRAIAAEAGAYRFVAPDNGVLTLALSEPMPGQVVELTEARYARSTSSRTFEGRDRFAPAAAWMATGVRVAALGPALRDWQRLDIPRPVVAADHIFGEVLKVDRFGNLVSNITRRMLEDVGREGGLAVAAGGETLGRVVATYADVPPGALCALLGSSDHLEIAVRGANAAERLGLRRGAPIKVARVGGVSVS